MKKKVLMNAGAALASQLVAVVCGFVLPRLILEYFGSEVNGLTQSIKQFLGIISFLDMGVGQVLRSALYKPLADHDHHQLSCVLASGRRFYRNLAYALVGYVLVLVFVYPALAEQEYGWLYTAALIVAMAISSFTQYFFGITNEQLLSADQRGYVIAILQIACNLLNVGLSVWMIRAGASIQAVKLMASLVYLVRPLVIHWYIRKRYSIDAHVRYTGEPLKQKWSGIAQHVSAVVLDGTDTIVLTLLSTLKAISVYSVYYTVVASIQNLYQSATAGFQSAAGALWAKGNRDAIHRMFLNTELLLHAVTVFLFSCMGILIVPFVQVYTQGLTDANYIEPLFAAILTVAYGIRSLRTPYNIWILAAGHFKQTQICHVLAAVINLVISVLAVVRWGLVGVAIGTLTAMLYQTLWMAVYTQRRLMQRPLREMLARFAVDALQVGLIYLATRGLRFDAWNYLAWFGLAIQVALLSAAVIVLTTAVIYRKRLAPFVQRLMRRRGLRRN